MAGLNLGRMDSFEIRKSVAFQKARFGKFYSPGHCGSTAPSHACVVLATTLGYHMSGNLFRGRASGGGPVSTKKRTRHGTFSNGHCWSVSGRFWIKGGSKVDQEVKLCSYEKL